MSVSYSVYKQKRDFSQKGELKYYAKAQSSGEMTFRTLTRRISDRCSLTPGDVMATLDACLHILGEALEDGKIVRLGYFGSFQISVFSEGTLKEEDFKNSNITGAKIVYRPGTDLKQLLPNLTYKKVDVKRSRANKRKK
jgi:predicted histone-like DNA-binding protein